MFINALTSSIKEKIKLIYNCEKIKITTRKSHFYELKNVLLRRNKDFDRWSHFLYTNVPYNLKH